MTKTVSVTRVAATSPVLTAAAKRSTKIKAQAEKLVAKRDAAEGVKVKPTRKAKEVVAAKPTRKPAAKGKVIARNRPEGHSSADVAAYFEAHGINPKTARAKLRRAGLNAPYAIADVKRVCAA